MPHNNVLQWLFLTQQKKVMIQLCNIKQILYVSGFNIQNYLSEEMIIVRGEFAEYNNLSKDK